MFLTPNKSNRIHSQFGNLNIIKDSTEGPAVEISPADALKRSISSGNKVRIFNLTGEVTSVARISNRVPAGSIVLPNGIWIGEGGGGNFLIECAETDIGYGAAFHDNMVEIEKIS